MMIRSTVLKTKRSARLSVFQNTGSGLLRAFPAEPGGAPGRVSPGK